MPINIVVCILTFLILLGLFAFSKKSEFSSSYSLFCLLALLISLALSLNPYKTFCLLPPLFPIFFLLLELPFSLLSDTPWLSLPFLVCLLSHYFDSLFNIHYFLSFKFRCVPTTLEFKLLIDSCKFKLFFLFFLIYYLKKKYKFLKITRFSPIFFTPNFTFFYTHDFFCSRPS